MRIPSVGGGGSFTYAGSNKPQDAEEGETWYDTGSSAAFVFVDNAGTTEQMSLEDHADLSGITVDAHRSDSNILAVVDGQVDAVDADTVDGQHASDLAGVSVGTTQFNDTGSNGGGGGDMVTVSDVKGLLYIDAYLYSTHSGYEYSSTSTVTKVDLTANYANGNSEVVWSRSVDSGGYGSGTTSRDVGAGVVSGDLTGSAGGKISSFTVSASYSWDHGGSADPSSSHEVDGEIAVLQ